MFLHLRRFYAIGSFACKLHKNVDRIKTSQVRKNISNPYGNDKHENRGILLVFCRFPFLFFMLFCLLLFRFVFNFVISTQMPDRIKTSQVKKHKQIPMEITKLKKTQKEKKTKNTNQKKTKNRNKQKNKKITRL